MRLRIIHPEPNDIDIARKKQVYPVGLPRIQFLLDKVVKLFAGIAFDKMVNLFQVI